MSRALASSGRSPEAIHSLASSGLYSGQTMVTGTSKRRSSVSRTIPWVTPAGTATAPAVSRCRAASSRSTLSAPSNGSQPGNAITPSTIGKALKYVSPSDDGKPPSRATRLTRSGRRSATSQASALAAE